MATLGFFHGYARLSVFSIAFILFLDVTGWAEDPVPPKQHFELGQVITEKGELVLFNGWQPNIRMQIGKNNIIGIGRTEADYESTFPIDLREYVENQYENDATLTLEYIGSVRIDYYDIPLPCFSIIRVEKLRVRKATDKDWKVIK